MTNDTEKSSVRDFWEEASAGEFWAIGADDRERLTAEAAQRYVFEPYLPPFADFDSGRDKDVLEIGTGMGTDHLHWAKAGPQALAEFTKALWPRPLLRLFCKNHGPHLPINARK